MILLKKILLTLIPLAALTGVVYFVPAPPSWPEASALQILAFFLPLLLFFTFLTNILFSYLPHAFIAGLGLMFIIVLQASNQISILSVVLTLAATILLIRLFPKMNYWFRLTRSTKIPKISQLDSSSSSRPPKEGRVSKSRDLK